MHREHVVTAEARDEDNDSEEVATLHPLSGIDV